MSLADALQTALTLKTALANEVVRSRQMPTLLKDVRSGAILEQVSQREAFNERSSFLSSTLAQQLADYAHGLGLADITLDELRRRAPLEGEALAGTFAELRALSTALAELDAFNSQLAEKALTFVSAYLSRLQPRPNAYTRRGGRPAQAEAGTFSERT